jgi:uncharacterized membrane protein
VLAFENEARANLLRQASLILLSLLITLVLAWELWLAPLRPGGSWLALKAVPLLVPLRGISAGSTYTFRWTTMLVLAYFAEGAVRAYTETGATALLAAIEIVLALGFFASAISYVRTARPTLP